MENKDYWSSGMILSTRESRSVGPLVYLHNTIQQKGMVVKLCLTY